MNCNAMFIPLSKIFASPDKSNIWLKVFAIKGKVDLQVFARCMISLYQITYFFVNADFSSFVCQFYMSTYNNKMYCNRNRVYRICTVKKCIS